MNNIDIINLIKNATIVKFDVSIPSNAFMEFWIEDSMLQQGEKFNLPIIKLSIIGLRPKLIEIRYADRMPICLSAEIEIISDETEYNYRIKFNLDDGLIDIMASDVYFSTANAVGI